MLKHFPMFVLLSFVTRLLVTGASVGDALALVALTALFGFTKFLEYQQGSPVNKEILERLSAVEKQAEEAKSKAASLQLASSVRR